MPTDLIVYALVAAGLVFWLRSVLGTRSEEDRQRPNPYIPVEQTGGDAASAKDQNVTPQDKIVQLSEHPKGNAGVDNKTAENGLLEISKADKNFDIEFFLQGAQDAFAMIVEAFADGDRKTLKDLLADPVYDTFDKAIEDREKTGEKVAAEIHSILKADIIAAKLQNKMAYITISFTADETRVVRDEDGEILSGHPDKVTKMKDIWTFGRTVNSKNPAWLVYETRSDDPDDNDLVPNTH